MEITKTSQEIEFNVSKALIIIEKDKDLNEMFREKYKTDFKMIHASINSKVGLKPEALGFINALFDGIILEKKSLTKAYLSLKDVGVRGNNTPTIEHSIIASEGVKEEKKTNKKKRWGLRAISDDVAQFFGGKETQIHRTANKVQNLKKIFTRLEIRMYNERFTKETLTEEQLKELGGAIEAFNKKVESVINPKK